MASHTVFQDSDKELVFEYPSVRRRTLNIFLVPFLNALPASSRSMIRRTHKSAETVVRYATQYRALEALYNYGYPETSHGLLQKIFARVWFGTLNARAVRNRLRIVEREVKKAIHRRIRDGKRVHILSIAAGSSRAIIESVVALGLKDNPSVKLTFLDKDEAALAYSRILASERNLTCGLEWVCSTAGEHLRGKHANEKFTVVEMVGLMDYFTDIKAIGLFDLIYNVLEDDGVFITANINHNKEKRFVKNVVGWDMIYRTPEEIVGLVAASAFKEHNITGYVEPLNIHTIVVAQKDHA